jgi:hypothetical protein
MEEAEDIPVVVGWYWAWGSAPWGTMYIGRYNGKEMKYYQYDYRDIPPVNLKLVDLREKEFIRKFDPLTPQEGHAMSGLKIIS